MSEILDVTVGYVSTRRGAKLHLVIDGGHAHCNSGTGVVRRSRKVRGDDAPTICKRCREALRSRLVDVINVRERRAHGGSANVRIIRACDALIDGMTTDSERARDAAVLDEIGQRITARPTAVISTVPTNTMAIPPECDVQVTLF